MTVGPDILWGESDDSPPPPNGLYAENNSVLGLQPNAVVQSISIQDGVSPDMVVGFYDVIPTYIKLAAYDKFGTQVSFLGVYSVFQNLTGYRGNNMLGLNVDGTFSGAVTPRPGGTVDSGYAGFAGFDPSITRIDILSTRPAKNGGINAYGDGYSVFFGSPPVPISTPTLATWSLLLLTFLVIGLGGWMWRRRAHN